LVEGMDLSRFEKKVCGKLGCLDEGIDGQKRRDLKRKFMEVCE